MDRIGYSFARRFSSAHVPEHRPCFRFFISRKLLSCGSRLFRLGFSQEPIGSEFLGTQESYVRGAERDQAHVPGFEAVEFG